LNSELCLKLECKGSMITSSCDLAYLQLCVFCVYWSEPLIRAKCRPDIQCRQQHSFRFANGGTLSANDHSIHSEVLRCTKFICRLLGRVKMLSNHDSYDLNCGILSRVGC
jgi:hypothetical protein